MDNESNSKLSQEDFDDLMNSGLDLEWIENSGARTITAAEAKQMGFSLKSKIQHTYYSEEIVDILVDPYVSSCLFLPFYDRFGNEIIDQITKKQVGIIKPRYIKETISDVWGFASPKYLCLPAFAQSRQYIHHPKGFDWNKFYSEIKIENLNITEGWKKAEAACYLGIPCICVYSVYCFNEAGMDTPLIPELKEVITKSNIRPVIIFDSDKVTNEGVDQAERMFVDKIANELKKQAFVINLPQCFNGLVTKGLDDFLKAAGKEGFDKLIIKSLDTPFLNASKLSEIPSIPRDSLPQIYREFINYVDENFEGCVEIAPLALFSQGAVALGKAFELNGKKANFYGMGIAETTSGKSSVAREITKPIQAINKELHDQYIKNLKPKDQNTILSDHFIVSTFTDEGLNYFLSNIAKNPIALFFETEEFDNFLSRLSKDSHTALTSSYVTKIYDAKYISPSYSYERQTKGLPIKTIYDPAITIAGVGTEIGIVSAMPKNSQGTGFDNRFQKFIGKHRLGKCVVQPKPIPDELVSRMQKIINLPITININSHEKISFRLSEESEIIYKNHYEQFKAWEDKDHSNPLIPYYRRSLTDYAFKLALQFQVISKIEEILTQEEDPETKFKLWLSDSSNLLISQEILLMALDWTKYFFNTAKYFYDKYLSKDMNLEVKLEMAINILKKYPQGLLSSLLRRDLGLHRNTSQRVDYEDILAMLVQANEIESIEGKRKNSKIIRLKSHLVPVSKSQKDHKA